MKEVYTADELERLPIVTKNTLMGEEMDKKVAELMANPRPGQAIPVDSISEAHELSRKINKVAAKQNEAQRDNAGKPDFLPLLDYFPLAFGELLKARMYGVEKYTDKEKGMDGLTNWSESMETEDHNAFQNGCRASAFRHLMAHKWDNPKDATQNDVYHMAYVALNAMMWLEYQLVTDSIEASVDK